MSDSSYYSYTDDESYSYSVARAADKNKRHPVKRVADKTRIVARAAGDVKKGNEKTLCQQKRCDMKKKQIGRKAHQTKVETPSRRRRQKRTRARNSKR